MRSSRRRNELLRHSLSGMDRRVGFVPVIRRALFFILLLSMPARAGEQVVWEPAQILDAEQIAESGAFVPLAIPTFFDNFRYPFLQDDGSVVFIANDAGSEGLGREGIFCIARNGEVRKLAEVGDYFYGTGLRLTGVSGLRVDGGRAVFRCGADDGSAGVGLWEDGRLFLLAQTGEAGGLGTIGYPGFAGNTVTFYAEGAGESGAVYALDLAAFPRVPRKLVDTTTTIPGSEGKLFGSFGFQQEAEDGVSVFRGFAVGARELLQFTGGSEQALGGVFRQNIREEGEPERKPEKILNTLAPLPGGPPGATFGELQNAIPYDGTVLVPSWTRDHSGLYYVGRDGQPRLVADTNTRIPELFDGNFTRFDKWAVNCAPWVIFIAEAGSYRGLFAMHMERNELFLLLDNRTELGGKTVSNFELGSRPKLGDNMVMAIEFTDGSSGVYLLKFGDGWGKAIFRRGAGMAAELVEEGSFRMIGNSTTYTAPDAATGETNKVDEAELIQNAAVFPAIKGLNFGYRYVLRSPGEDRCDVGGFDMFVVHPPMKGPDGKVHTHSTIPMKVCFKDGKAEDFVIYSLEENIEVLPGQWILQVRKDHEVLLSRSFTLL